MAKSRVKAKDFEKLDDVSVANVIQLLEADSPITKKAACEYLNISYNTSRLNKIIEGYKERKLYEEKRRKALRGKPFDSAEIKYTILNYLKGDSISAIAKSQYRSTTAVKNILKEYDIPAREATHNYWNPTIVPDEAVSEGFELGELVWSARYNCVSEIKSVKEDSRYGKVYHIWVFGKHNEGAYQPWYELGKLDILKKLGVTNNDFEEHETKGLFYSIR